MMEPVALSAEERAIWDALRGSGLSKPGFLPVCENHDSASPRVSKFGGAVPHLPDAPAAACESQHQQELLVQLYVPSLPAPARALFQPDCALVVVLYCTECMDSGISPTVALYSESQLDSLVYANAKSDAAIEARTITAWREFCCVDFTSEAAYDSARNAGLDEIQMEELGREIKDKYAGGTYLMGVPRYEQGEYEPGDGFVLLANFEQDSNFSMMWGDAGVAQLWMKTGAEFGEFNLTWMCG